jgi:hypothetical protein
MSTIAVNTITDASGGTTATINGYTPTVSNMAGRNRIINGAMMIDQRNAGAATANTISNYTLDRWQVLQSTSGKIIAQQNAGSVTPPVGFTNYLGLTSQSAYSVVSGDYFLIRQPIEGLNVSDLGWGTASAVAVTVSFKVYSSLTGTFGGSINNSAQSRSYPFSYTVSSANTWTTVSVTVAGDTSGTWLTTNGVGLYVVFSYGTGSTYSGTAGSWAGTTYFSATGATSVVGTNGATFYITGVQLEKGTVATPFDYRQYGTELALCQRYYEKSYNIDVVPGAVTSNGVFTNGGLTNMAPANYATRASTIYKVTKRATPTVTTYDTAGNAGKCNYPDTATNQSFTVIHNGFTTFSAETSTLSNGTDTRCYWHFTSSAEL